MIITRVSIRNIINISFIFVGTIFFLYSYMLNIIPVVDLGYMNLKEIYMLDLLLLLIILVCVFVIVKNHNLIYRGKIMCIKSTALCIAFNTFKIVFCISLAYCFFYYSITFV
ncbi:MAG: hypothetical protein AB7S78_10075 [Candidatus Omnitrophota bacterium]